jgi:3-hydroxy-3-methylglutaryl CoA synthase
VANASTGGKSPSKAINLDKDHCDYFVAHCTSTYLCRRAYKTFCDEAYSKGEEKITVVQQNKQWNTKALPATQLTKRIGSSYTASAYTNLTSLIAGFSDSDRPEKLGGKKIILFSYGSGGCSAMYRIKVTSTNLEALNRVCPSEKSRNHPFKGILENRTLRTVPVYLDFLERYSGMYGKFDVNPADSGNRQSDVYYLNRVCENGRRYYSLGGK